MATVEVVSVTSALSEEITKEEPKPAERTPQEVWPELKSAVADLRNAMGKDNIDEIKAKLDAANKAVLKIGQHMSGGSEDDDDDDVDLFGEENEEEKKAAEERAAAMKASGKKKESGKSSIPESEANKFEFVRRQSSDVRLMLRW